MTSNTSSQPASALPNTAVEYERIEYHGVIDDQHHREIMQRLVLCPVSWLDKAQSSSEEERNTSINKIITILFEQWGLLHHWHCVECDSPATKYLHYPRLNLDVPRCHDKLTPLCFLGGKCHPRMIRKSAKEDRERREDYVMIRNCNLCHSLAKTKGGKCELVYYCSKECQKGDWKEHKQGCKERKKRGEASSEAV